MELIEKAGQTLTEPVSVAEVKNFCKITTSADDDVVAMLITSARDKIEKYLNRSVVTKVYQCVFRAQEADGKYNLPMPPITTVASVIMYDKIGTATSMTANSDYYVVGIDKKQIICDSWQDSLFVEYTSGFAVVPELIKQAIQKEVFTMYNNRENIVVGSISKELENSVRVILAPYRNIVIL